MEAKDLGGPAAVVGLDLLPPYPTEVLEDGYGLGEVACGSEPAPPPALDVACLRAIFDVAAVDPPEEGIGAPLRRVEHGRVDPDCVRPEVLTPPGGAVPVDSHLQRLDRADAGQLLGVRDEAYGLHDALGDIEDERRDRLVT